MGVGSRADCVRMRSVGVTMIRDLLQSTGLSCNRLDDATVSEFERG
jgi:hypothetical protein